MFGIDIASSLAGKHASQKEHSNLWPGREANANGSQEPILKLANKSIKRRRRHAALGWWWDLPFLLIPSTVAWAYAGRIAVSMPHMQNAVGSPKDPMKLATVDGLIVFMQPKRRKGLPTTPGDSAEWVGLCPVTSVGISRDERGWDGIKSLSRSACRKPSSKRQGGCAPTRHTWLTALGKGSKVKSRLV